MIREEAIKWLQRIENTYIHGGDEAFDESRKEALHMAIDALENTEYIINLQKTYQRFVDMWGKLYEKTVGDEWIPCSERLPKDDNDYLVVDSDGEMAVGYYRDDADAWDNSCFGWLEREDEDEHPTRLGKVVAWMPIPKPYERKGIEHAPDCPFCVRYETDECLKNECKHLQSYKESEVEK